VQGPELEATIATYLQAFDSRDLARCTDFFAEDASIHFGLGTYRGRQAVEEWHKDRFAADVRVVRVERVASEGDSVKVDAVVTSRVARAWRFNSVAGTGSFVFNQGKITEAKFSLRMSLPLEGW
jgi:hypothetical protein